MYLITIDAIQFIMGSRVPITFIHRLAKEGKTIPEIQEYVKDMGYIMRDQLIEKALKEYEGKA